MFRNQNRSRRFILIAIGATLLSGVLVLALIIYKNSANDGTTTFHDGLGVDGPLTKINVNYEQMPLEGLQERVNYLQATNQLEEATKLIKLQDYFDKSAEAQILLASVQGAQQKHEEALQTLLSAEKIQSQPGLLVNIAEAAENLKEYQLATSYYKKAVVAYEKMTNGNSSELDRLKAKVTELENQQP